MSRGCTTCRHGALPSSAEPCWSCASATPPSTRWEPVPTHPPSAPYTDTQRLDWLLPVMTLADDPARVGDKRTVALAAAFVLGKSGREAIDFAMEGDR